MTSFIFVIIAMVLVFGYTTAMCIANKEIPSSLSETVFHLKPSQSWLWAVCMGLAAFFTIPSLIDACSENTKFLAFLTILGLLFSIGIPMLRNKSDMASKTHLTAAALCVIASQVMIALNCPWLLLFWLPCVVFLIIYSRKSQPWRTQIFWAEMTAFASTFAFSLT